MRWEPEPEYVSAGLSVALNYFQCEFTNAHWFIFRDTLMYRVKIHEYRLHGLSLPISFRTFLVTWMCSAPPTLHAVHFNICWSNYLSDTSLIKLAFMPRCFLIRSFNFRQLLERGPIFRRSSVIVSKRSRSLRLCRLFCILWHCHAPDQVRGCTQILPPFVRSSG